MLLRYESLSSNLCSSQSLDKQTQTVWENLLHTNYSLAYLQKVTFCCKLKAIVSVKLLYRSRDKTFLKILIDYFFPPRKHWLEKDYGDVP